MLSKKEVQHIAKLARLDLTEKEIAKYRKELSAILDYIEKLKEVDVSGIEPTSHLTIGPFVPAERRERERKVKFLAAKIENTTRADRSGKPAFESKKLLELAPETKNGYLKTKSIL